MCIIYIHKLSNKILIQVITNAICIIYIRHKNCATKLLCNTLEGKVIRISRMLFRVVCISYAYKLYML